MAKAVVCGDCGEDVPVTSNEVECEACGWTCNLQGLVRPSERRDERPRTEKEEVRAGWRLMKAVRPDAKIYDTSQPQQAKITPGLPDWIVFDAVGIGLFFYEWKTEDGRLTDAQQEFRDWAEAVGVPYHHGPVEELARILGLSEDESPTPTRREA